MVRVGVVGEAVVATSNTVKSSSAVVPLPLAQLPNGARTSKGQGSWRTQLAALALSKVDMLTTPPQQTEKAKHTAVTPSILRAMSLRSRLRFYLSRPEESRIGWIVHHCVIGVLVVNACVLAVETLDGPRNANGSDPAYPFLPGDGAFRAAECFFSALYLAEFLLRWMVANSQRRVWQSKQTWMALLGLLPIFVVAGARSSAEKSTRTAAEVVAFNLRLVRVMRIPVLSRVYVGSKVLFGAMFKSIAPLSVTVSASDDWLSEYHDCDFVNRCSLAACL